MASTSFLANAQFTNTFAQDRDPLSTYEPSTFFRPSVLVPMADSDVQTFCVLISTSIMNNVLIAVSQRSVFLAESRVVGCDKCSNRATIRFERLLDDVTGLNEQSSYILPSPAMCPFCTSPITETTLVQLRRDDQCGAWALGKFDQEQE
jgi:hypothetical protein